MDDLRTVIAILFKSNPKETEELIKEVSTKFTSKQWEYIVKAEASLIKYAPQDVQDKYSLKNKVPPVIINNPPTSAG